MSAYEVSIVSIIGINIMLAVSLNMISGFCGQVSLGHGAFFGAGAYAAALVMLGTGSVALALGMALITGSALGVIVCGVLITLCNNWMSFSFHAYQAELYPTRIRARAVGFVYSWSRFSAIFSGFVIAFFLGHYGTIGVFGFIAGAMLVVIIVIGGFGPAVTKRRLEAIAT